MGTPAAACYPCMCKGLTQCMMGVSFDWYLIGDSYLMAGTAEILLTAAGHQQK